MATAALALGAALLSGCGGSLAAPGGTTAYLGTQSPGDVWSWTFDNGSFTATNDTLQHNYTGTSQDLPSGFKKLTISTTDDANVTVGSAGYALEIPGVALLVKPAGGDAVKPIIATTIGADPSGAIMACNYIVVPHAGWDCTQEEAFGTAVFTKGTDHWTGDITHYLLDGTQDPQHGSGTFTCHDGRLEIDGGQSQGALTPAGLAFIDNGPGMGGLVGVPIPTQNIDWADFSSHEFRGLMLQQGRTECIWMQPDPNGGLHGGAFQSDGGIETNTIDSDPNHGVHLTLVGQPGPGMLRIDVVSHDGQDQVAMMVAKVNGKYVGFALGGNANQGAFNVLLMQKD
jgi:hypothetical protein